MLIRPKNTILWCIYGVLIYFLVQFIYGLIVIVLFNMETDLIYLEVIKPKFISFPITIVNIAIFGPIMEEILTKKIIIGYVTETNKCLYCVSHYFSYICIASYGVSKSYSLIL